MQASFPTASKQNYRLKCTKAGLGRHGEGTKLPNLLTNELFEMIGVLLSYLFNFSKIKTAVKIEMTKFFLLFGKNLPVEFVNMFH